MPTEILVWEDDPMSGAAPIKKATPDLAIASLNIHIIGEQPIPKIYEPGTPEFRYWVAADGLRRCADFWAALLPAETRWTTGESLPVELDGGVGLGAFYDPRIGIKFFRYTVGNHTIYAGESPDLCCHEIGHAILDSIRSDVRRANYYETKAFHESFGDISAILSSLQLPSFRKSVLVETQGHLFQSSRLSRLGEQLGWATRWENPNGAGIDCLRNAFNSFVYRNPARLPSVSAASSLSSKSYSFSLVFTGGFFRSLSLMLASLTSSPAEDTLQRVSIDAGRLLIEAIMETSILPNYYSRIVTSLLRADERLYGGRYRNALETGFGLHGIFSLESTPKRHSYS